MVVDDEAMVRRTLERSLQIYGFEVEVASGGREALEIFQRASSEMVAVLLDLTMPDMDGEETLKELRKIRPDVKVILVSGFDEQEIALRFRENPPSSVLKKPFRPRELKEKMYTLLKTES